ncbi:hypothetical protein PIROE2DRAFT_13569 [Piromyces sp. E2]|nr:hypothetical protein PIROE2DRAFT_13569 [Piromyces sp. E2]|eukprot:OUM60623.1 hypothetical protein PIROE2DRAFT_13569 [Piromyces sp. E2]
MILSKLIYFLYFHLYISFGISITIDAIAFTYFESNEIFSSLVKDFNEYSEENNLDIYLKLNLLSPLNSTVHNSDYGSSIYSLLQKKSDKYDLYFYDNVYSSKFGSHFYDLNDILPKEHIDMYEYEIISQSYKYHKSIPKTWDELLKTSKYIVDEEKKINNTKIIGYSGGYVDDELGSCSISEFIFTYRDSIKSSFPKFSSSNSIEALKLNPIYSLSILPGFHEGVSGSIIGGYNLGICQYSKNEKKEAAITALKYITSKECQKKYILERGIFSGIKSLFDDEEVCQKVDCNFRKSVQPLRRPFSNSFDYDIYTNKYRKYIFEFLYGNEEVEQVLQNVEDITKIYYVSFDGKMAYLGFITVILSSLLTVIVVVSVFCIFNNKFESYFNLLSNDFWIIIAVGLIIIINSSYFDFGLKNEFKFIEKVLIEKNYEICKVNNQITNIIIFINYLSKIVQIISILILIYMEWNIEDTKFDVQLIVSAIYSDILLLKENTALSVTIKDILQGTVDLPPKSKASAIVHVERLEKFF